MDTINLSLSCTGSVSASPCLLVHSNFVMDPASYDVIDAPAWVPSGGHRRTEDGMVDIIFGENLRD